MEFFREIISLKKKDGVYVINLDEYEDVGTHWIALFCNRSDNVYFDSSGVEHVPEEIKEFIENKNIKDNIFLVQANNSVLCGYFCVGFIDFMLAGKKLTDFTCFFFLMTLKRMMIQVWVILKMNEIDKTSFLDQTKFRLNQGSKIENYFNSEIN